jgi:hypothetical protein
MVFDGVGKQSAVDIVVFHAGGRASESTMFGGGVGWGCPICDTRAVALATNPPRLDLVYRRCHVLSQTSDFLVFVLNVIASLTTQHSEQSFKIPAGGLDKQN